MNAPTTDRLDSQLKTMFRTVAESAPQAPDVADIVRGPIAKVSQPSVHRRPLRWVAAAAAVSVALAGGVVWSLRVEPASKPADQPEPATPASRLDKYLMPTYVPDEWVLSDISEFVVSDQPDHSQHVWVIAEPGGSRRGVLTVSGSDPGLAPPATAEESTVDTAATLAETDVAIDSNPITPTTAVASPWSETDSWSTSPFWSLGSLSWSIDDYYMSLVVNTSIESEARSMKSALQLVRTNGTIKYSVDEDSAYVVEQDLGNVDVSPRPVASLGYLDADGLLIQIDLIPEPAVRAEVLVDPALADGPAVAAVLPGADGLVSGALTREGLSISFNSSSGSDHTPAEAIAVLDSMVLVSDDAWDAAADEVAARINAEPVIGWAYIVGGTLSIHNGDRLDGICFTTSGQIGCRSRPQDVVEPDSGEWVSAELLVGDRWVVVERLPEGISTHPIDIERMAGQDGFNCVSEQPGPERDCGEGIVERAVVTTDAGTFVVLSAPPGVSELVISVGDVENREIAEQHHVRPIR